MQDNLGDIILGIEIMGERKYGDFFEKSPNFVPRIKLTHFHPKLFQRNRTKFSKKFDHVETK